MKGPSRGFDKTALAETQTDQRLVPFQKVTACCFWFPLKLALFESPLPQRCSGVASHRLHTGTSAAAGLEAPAPRALDLPPEQGQPAPLSQLQGSGCQRGTPAGGEVL